MKESKKKSYLEISAFVLISVLPTAIALSTIFMGNIDFGYDTARDFISGLNNISKLTLIGPTSGIPGVFYGPYWIWLLSLGLFFSKDPRSVVFLVLTIPYFIVFPYILFKFKKIFGFVTCLLLWIIFILGPGMKYAVSAWNPHPAPLLFLVAIYLLIFTDLFPNTNKTCIKNIVLGILLGLIINFHISFGLGTFVGFLSYFIIDFARGIYIVKKRFENIAIPHAKRIAAVGLGLIITFAPFLLFETRHGFNQIKTAINVFTSPGSVVTVSGLNNMQITQSFFGKAAELIKIPPLLLYFALATCAGYVVFQVIKKKISFSEEEVRLLLLLLSLAIGILTLYLSSKNPVWSYHFIGSELIFLLVIGIILLKIRFLNYVFALWILGSLVLNSSYIVRQFPPNPYTNSSSLYAEKRIVDTILIDAGKSDFTVFAYSPAIYAYEYEYIFKWRGGKYVPYDPGMNPKNANTIYLIIPRVSLEIKRDFINYRAPDSSYKTVNEWNMQDGTLILKRVRTNRK